MRKHLIFFGSLTLIVALILYIASGKKTSSGIVPPEGVQPAFSTWLIRAGNGKWGVYDGNGNEVAAAKYDGVLPEDELFGGAVMFEYGKDLPDSVANYGAFVRVNGKWGFLNKAGTETLSPRFDSVKYFHEGRAWVYSKSKWGIVDGEGKMVVQPAFDNPRPFQNGYAVIQKDGLCGAVDKSGNLVVPARYTSIEDFKTGGISISERANWFRFVNTSGEELSLPKFSTYQQVNDGFVIEDDSRKGFVSSTGQLVIPLAYQEINPSNACFYVRQYGQWGVLGKGGEEIVPCKYLTINPTSDGYQTNSKGFTGLYSSTGALVVPCFYETISRTDIGFLCRLRDKYALFGFGGEQLISWQYQYDEIQVEGANYARVKKDGLYGWYDLTKRQIAIPLQYDFVWDKFTSTQDVVKVRRDGQPLKIDYYGKEVEGKDAEEWFNEKVRPAVKKIVENSN